jgi:UDP-2,4-diacetamido-2,4,6-trideoxy-beta-L-altropyranose hydrolase
LPSVTVVAAENQRRIASMLVEAGAAELIDGKPGHLSEALRGAVVGLAADASARHAMSSAAFRVVDGLGTARTVDALIPYLSDDGRAVHLRPATMADAELILGWQSNPVTRRYFTNSNPPSRDDHFRWLAARLGEPLNLLHIIEHGGAPAGVLRLECASGSGDGPTSYEISVLVAPGSYRRGIGRAALAAVRRLVPEAVLVARVLAENDASHHLFESAGFRRTRDLYCSLPTKESHQLDAGPPSTAIRYGQPLYGSRRDG